MTAVVSGTTATRARPVPTGLRARRDATVRLAAGSLLWLSLLLVTYWWVAGGGVQDLGGRAGGLTSAGRITGLVASVLLLAQVVLMARVPVLEAAFGQDRLAAIHRLVGFTSFNLMLAHLVLITWGYAGGRLAGTPATAWDLTVNYPGMLLAVAGTACLVMVVATSVKAARRRLRYESWHLLHLYAYLGVGLALPHQLWTGKELEVLPRALAVLVVGVGRRRGRRAHVAGGPAPVAQPAPPAAGHLGRRRGAGRRLGLPHRAPPRPAAGRGRPVPRLPLPGPPRLDPRPPLLPLRGTGRPQPAHHRAGRRRRQRGELPPAAGHPGPLRGAVRPARRPRPHPAQGGADRRRGRHHPAARASRGAGLPARRGRDAEALHHRGALHRRARGPRPRAWPAGAVPARAPPRTRLVAAARRRRGLRPRRPALLGPRHRTSATCSCAAPRPGPSWSAGTCSRPACSPDQIHLETFAW